MSEGVLRLVGAIVLSVFSAIFAGLTLGLMTLDLLQLRVLIECGTNAMPDSKAARYARYAQAVLIIRRNGNFLLVTLLILNVAVNAAFSILMGETTSGLIGFLIATTVLTVFGEIIPQAVFSRHALPLCYWFVPLVIVCEVIMTPLSWPLAALLNAMLGSDMGKTYTREQLAQLIRHHSSEAKVLERDEGQIVGGSLSMAAKKASDAMTPIDQVFGLSSDEILDSNTMKRLLTSGFSRFAVFKTEECQPRPVDTCSLTCTENESAELSICLPAYGDDAFSSRVIRGFLYVKDLVLINPDDCVKAKDALALFGRALFAVDVGTSLLTLLNFFKAGKSHIAVVRRLTSDEQIYEHCGIITLEDIIEEILQDEILDEFDFPPSTLAGPNRQPPSSSGAAADPSPYESSYHGVMIKNPDQEILAPSKSFVKARLVARQQLENDTNLRAARIELLYEQDLSQKHLTVDQAQVVLNFLNSCRIPPFVKRLFSGQPALDLLLKAPVDFLPPGYVLQAQTITSSCLVVLQGHVRCGPQVKGAWTVLGYELLVSPSEDRTFDTAASSPQNAEPWAPHFAGPLGCSYVLIMCDAYEQAVKDMDIVEKIVSTTSSCQGRVNTLWLYRSKWSTLGPTVDFQSADFIAEKFMLPRVVLAFMAPHGLALPEVWSVWIENARIQLDELGLEPLKETCQSFDSQLLVPVVSVRGDTPVDDVSKFPCWLGNATIVQPAEVKWGNLNPVFYSILEAMQPSSTANTHYIFVSDTSIPVADFTEILTELTADPRSHFDMWREDFAPCFAKTSGWFTLSQRHADMLLAARDLWYHDKGLFSPSRTSHAQADEIAPFRAIVDLENGTGSKRWFHFLRGRSCSSAETKSWPSTVALSSVGSKPFWGTQSVFWYRYPVTSRGYLGGGKVDQRHPLEYARVNGYYLRFLMEKSWTWFARKFSSDSMVTSCRNSTENGFISDWIGLSEKPVNKWPLPKQPGRWSRWIFGDSADGSHLTPAEDPSVCTIRDFLVREDGSHQLPY